MNGFVLYIPPWYLPLVSTVGYAALTLFVIRKLEVLSDSLIPDILNDRYLRRYNYNLVKKQLNRLRANIPQIDSIVERSEYYTTIVKLSDDFGEDENGDVVLDIILSNTPVFDFLEINKHLLSKDVLNDCQLEAVLLDADYRETRVLTV